MIFLYLYIYIYFTQRKSPFLVGGKYLAISVINRVNVIAATEMQKANKPNREKWLCYNGFIMDFKKFAFSCSLLSEGIG